MSITYIIIENKKDWRPSFPNSNVLTAEDFLFEYDKLKKTNIRIINLCKNYKYLSIGYYSSLLSEARGKKVIPSIQTINDLRKKSIYSLNLESLSTRLEKQPSNTFRELKFNVFFGRASQPEMNLIAREVFELFPSPLLTVTLCYDKLWKIESIKPISLTHLEKIDELFFVESLDYYCKNIWVYKKTKKYRYDLAILHNPEEISPPSNKTALKNFIRIGNSLDINVDLLQKKHYSRLAEYDALFIRETTTIENHTYRFAKKAESEGMIVVDDPTSILRCTNKIYLSDLLKKNKIPAPKDLILGKNHINNCASIVSKLNFPIVLKIPDGAFSKGIFKINSETELKEKSKVLFMQSDLILAQEYMFTEYDWRIGILNSKPIYGCQYYMSKGHWQIVNYMNNKSIEGGFRTFPIEDVPKEVVHLALKAANLIGDGLYGVDIKQTSNGVYVIEVNDNPNLDAGIEDYYLKDQLYKIILEDFIRRLEAKWK